MQPQIEMRWPAGPPADAALVDVSVVIINWNTRDLLHACLHSLYATHGSTTIEIIVVDNASSDGSVMMVRHDFPQARLITNERNEGFAAANNRGIAQARGRYFLLLNSDTIVLTGAIAQMVLFMDSHPHVGVLGPRLLNEDGSLQSSMREFPRLRDDVLGLLELQRWPLVGRLARWHTERTSVSWSDHRHTRDVDWVTGACQMLRREAATQVGGLDSGYFFFFEEMDLCYRMRQCGWVTTFDADAEIVHLGGRSAARVPSARLVWHFKSMLRFYRLHCGRRRFMVLRATISIVALTRVIRLMLLSRPSRETSLALAAYAHVLAMATRYCH